MKLIRRDGDTGTVEYKGVRKQINLLLLDDPKIGDYLIIHAGFAIETIRNDALYNKLFGLNDECE